MKVAVVQLNSRTDSQANVNRALEFIDRAASDGAELVALPETFFCGEVDIFYLHRVKAHNFCGDGVNCHLVRRGEIQVGLMRGHSPRSGSRTRGGPVHKGKNPRVDFLLNRQKVN